MEITKMVVYSSVGLSDAQKNPEHAFNRVTDYMWND